MSADSRRIVREVLTRHAAGDDPALAAAALAELRERAAADRAAFRTAVHAMSESFGRAFQRIARGIAEATLTGAGLAWSAQHPSSKLPEDVAPRGAALTRPPVASPSPPSTEVVDRGPTGVTGTAPGTTSTTPPRRILTRPLEPMCPRWAHHEGRCHIFVHGCDPDTVGAEPPTCDRDTCQGLHPPGRRSGKAVQAAETEAWRAARERAST